MDHENKVLDVTITPDGKRVVTASSGCVAAVLDLETHGVVSVFRGHSEAVLCVVALSAGWVRAAAVRGAE